MTQERQVDKEEGLRPGRIALLLLGVLAVSCLLAPLVFNLLLFMGRVVDAFSGLRNLYFKDVAARVFQGVLVIGLLLARRWVGLTHARHIGLGRVPAWRRHLVLGWLAGSAGVALLLGCGWLAGAYNLRGVGGAALAGRALLLVATGFLVGVIEEPLFRGLVFGAFRRRLGFWAAALPAGLLFSAIHFAKPEFSDGVVHAGWDAGFLMLREAFPPGGPVMTWLPQATTLLLLGLLLSLLYERFGQLYAAIGLHAGIVWVVLLASKALVRAPDHPGGLFGSGVSPVKTPAALVLSAVLLAVALWLFGPTGRKGRPPA